MFNVRHMAKRKKVDHTEAQWGCTDDTDDSHEPSYAQESEDSIPGYSGRDFTSDSDEDQEQRPRCFSCGLVHSNSCQQCVTSPQAASWVHSSLSSGCFRTVTQEDPTARRALLVIDMSIEQVAHLKQRKAEIVQSIRRLAQFPGWVTKVDSRLWLHTPSESTLSLAFPNVGHAHAEGSELIPELSDLCLTFVEKKHYSAFVDSTLGDHLRDCRVDEVIITGINTDYCIFLTAMDAFARGRYKTVVVEDAVGSVSGPAGHTEGLARIEAHIPGATRTLEQVLGTFSLRRHTDNFHTEAFSSDA